MNTLKIAIRDSKNINKTSKYDSGNELNKKKSNLWYVQSL